MVDGAMDRVGRSYPFAAANEPRVYRYLRRFTMVVLAIWIPLALFSGYRALVQVYSLDLRVSPSRLEAGSTITAAVATSGRVHVRVVLELIQDGRSDTLDAFIVRSSRPASIDPRARRALAQVTLTPDMLTRLHPGAVTLRATAIGQSQWLRTPPPTVRTVDVVR